MKNHLPNFHFAGSSFHFHKPAVAHHQHSNHNFHAMTHAAHMPHPLHWAHTIAHELYQLHLVHRFNVMLHKVVVPHAGHWISEHTFVVALLLTLALGYAAYVVISKFQFNDYTSGVWAVFG